MENKKICVIRIKGRVGLDKSTNETFNRMRLRRKFACVVLEPTKENTGMIDKVKNFVAFGELNEEMHKELIQKRGKKDASNKLKPFFRLHPPRKGINSKLHYPKGVLGNHKDKINLLLERML